MAARVLRLGHAENFRETPIVYSARTIPPPTGLDRRNQQPPKTALRFDISCTDLGGQYKLSTPDSGFFGTSNTPLKTPESDFSSATVTPPSGGSGNSQRKRKTVTIDESQTSIVVISPDDLFLTYSRCQGQSLESRDNPFLPGGELSREAEDLLSRATIIRDHFYLNEEEKRTLRQHQLEQEHEKLHQRSGKHVHIVENPDDVAHARTGSLPSTPPSEAVEERISPQLEANNLATAATRNGDDSHQPRAKENGKFNDVSAASDNDRLAVADGGSQSQVPGGTEAGSGAGQISAPGDLQVREADKKKRNKCCTIM